MKRIVPLALIVAVLFAMLPLHAAQAAGPTPVEDQSYTAPGIAAVAFSGCCQYVAQTFTAGMTGALTGVSIDVASGDLYGELHVQIVGVTAGVPNGKLLGERYLWTPDLQPIANAPLSYVAELAPIYVTAGTQYAIVVNYTGTAADGGPHGTWSGGEGNPYPRGRVFLGDDYLLANWTAAESGLDLHFRTFVVPNVPVSDLKIVRLSGPKNAHACQVFRETYRVTNLGPDAATRVFVGLGGTDQFGFISVNGAPDGQPEYFDLAAGESKTIIAYYKVVGFVPGESRSGWISASVGTDVYPDIAIDLDVDNNTAGMEITLVGKPVMSCRR